MGKDEVKNLKLMSKLDKYNNWIYDNVKEFLGERILEVGGGVGNFTEFILKKQLIISTDINEKHIITLNNKFKANKNFQAILIDVSKDISKIKEYKFDTAISINVLEHIKDDMYALKNMHKLLNKNGKMVLVLPAFQFAFGTIDKSDNHYRRYNKNIIPKIEKIGFKIIKNRYMNLPGLVGWIWHGKILKLKIHKEGDLIIFNKLIPLFSFFEKIFPFLPGLSLIIIGEKK